jgi:hypothetical protein
MEDVNFLLNDRYVQFAQRIIELNILQKLVEQKLHQNREEFNSLHREMWEIRDKVNKAQGVFEDWKKECLSNCGDG